MHPSHTGSPRQFTQLTPGGPAFPVPDPASTRLSHVGEQFNELDSALNGLHEVALRLTDRIAPVVMLRAAVESKDGGAPPRQSLVPVAERIRSMVDRVKATASMLECSANNVEC